MRLNHEKILKTWDESDNGCFIDPQHTTGLAPYNMDNMFADDRAKRFTGLVDRLIAKNNWIPLGEESSKTLMRKIRDAKDSPRKYAIMQIDGTSYDTRLLWDYIKHYQRESDVIQFFKMTHPDAQEYAKIMQMGAPIVLTTNEEWYYIVAPRIAPEGQENTDAVLFNPPADIWDDMPTDDMPTDEPYVMSDKSYIDTVLPALKFNPTTGEFE